MRAAAVTWFPVFPFPAEKGNKNRNMIVLKSIYVQKNKPNSTTTTTTTNNKQTNKKRTNLDNIRSGAAR